MGNLLKGSAIVERAVGEFLLTSISAMSTAINPTRANFGDPAGADGNESQQHSEQMEQSEQRSKPRQGMFTEGNYYIENRWHILLVGFVSDIYLLHAFSSRTHTDGRLRMHRSVPGL